jgi:hypothetical protein
LKLGAVGATSDSQDGSEIVVRLWKEGAANGTAARTGVSATSAMEVVVSRLKMLAEVADENAKVWINRMQLKPMTQIAILQIYPCANLVWRTSSSVYKVRYQVT